MFFSVVGTISAQIGDPGIGIPPSPKYEVRAVWIATLGGLDWPKSFNSTEQQRSLQEMVGQVKAANFNTIFFQVRARGDAMYRSRYEPWSQPLTGQSGKDPGWDPLQFVLDEAHAQGLEVHAWFNTFIVKTGNSNTVASSSHVTNLHPDWVRRVNGEWWLDPGLPQVRTYVVKVVMDLVRSYDVDGIHFDFIRYPGLQYPDETTFRRYGEGMTREEWRRANINTFVHAVYDSIKAMKPMLKVGSTPIGIYVNVPSGSGWESFHSVFQDSRSWLRERKHDYLAPQVYWPMGNPDLGVDFAVVAADWSQNSFGRHIYIGIGAYKPQVHKQLPDLIDVCRNLGLLGNSFFRYEHISRWWRVGERYAFPAIIPPMAWKDPTPPEQPKNLSVQDLGEGKFGLLWQKPPSAVDGDMAQRYVIYRSRLNPVDITDAANIDAITVNADTSYLDVISHPTSIRYYYAVTALDKQNNESLPTNEQSVVISELAEMAKQFSLTTKLADTYTSQKGAVRLIPFEVREWATVQLTILDSTGTSVQTLVDEIRPAGKYVEAVNASQMRPGLYLVQLLTGKEVSTKPLRIEQ